MIELVMGILKEEDSGDILHTVYECGYSTQTEEFVPDTLDHLVRDIRALAEYHISNGGKDFKIGIFSDLDLLKERSNGTQTLVIDNNSVFCWAVEEDS